MNMDDMVLISVDDHLIEPPNMFDRHTPAKFKGRMPHIVQGPQGEDMWMIGAMPVPNIALNAVAGRRPEEYGFEPTGFAQLRKGTYDVHARIGDMNVNGQLAGLNFPSFVGVGGQTLEKVQDRELGLAIVRAWNDWHIDEWCGAYPGRFIPVGIVSNWDPIAAAEEVRRIAKKGCYAISFPPNPSLSKLPSLHNPIWDPLWKACSDTGVVVCLHIADASNAVPSIESPVDVMIANMPVSLYATATDLTFSPILRKFPDIRFALSEGGVGWIPHFLERIDYVHERHTWTNQDFGGMKPSELFKKHVYTCFIDDKVGIKVRHDAGLSKMTWECDYPHSDSTWPKAPETLWPSIKDIPAAEIDMITHLNAMKAFQFDPFKHIKKEDCTVGALRAQAGDVDLSFTDTKGKGVPPAEHSGPVTFGDVTGQLTKMIDVGAKT
ncbi:amidohydrolase family protein [Zhongshania sp.]|uniref:amidohydrolase family protein n=1 Tax=Zhongshania sp. TaxID=1971902 RepID=UPI001B763BE3|nr:amidohydrolase family protein [Zhongshania sp.]MBQ0794847.1 amidohydrolase family protein [Zhongshania sp.]